MAGGLLNIVSIGNNNVFLTGNPSKTFFKVIYAKYSNFGLQKFRIDYDGTRDLRLTEPSTFTFKIPRYADLLMDTYLVINLPDIWSPIYNPTFDTSFNWAPYEFRWIENIGALMIKEVNITCGSLLIQKYSGQYISSIVERDFTKEKKELFNNMTGNVIEMNDPANAYGRANAYPSAYYTSNLTGAEPSIRGRKLYIPLNTWFSMSPGCAFPLVALQYNELHINIILRPIQELFQIRDVFDNINERPYIQPDFNVDRFQLYRFLQTPPSPIIDPTYNYQNKLSMWNADIHLLSTYCFLSDEESKKFAMEDHVYLVKDIFEYNFENISGTKRVKLNNSGGMVSSWMWFLQRNDINLRNEWNNYTNWPYRNLPINGNTQLISPYSQEQGVEGQSLLDIITDLSLNENINFDTQFIQNEYKYTPEINPINYSLTGYSFTGDYSVNNQKEIMNSMGIVFDGEYRENILTSGIYNYIEKYTRTTGNAKEGLYCYNFCLDSNSQTYQPSGAINLSRFRNIELEVITYVPPIDLTSSNIDVICDLQGNPIGIRKSNWRLYDYNYNLMIMEERYNILSFISGSAGMMYAR